MDVNVIGGGPGGAYVSLLLKKSNPEWDVTVYERRPPATTYGWAIVLPDKTYTTLRDADEPTCEEIVDLNTKWDPIDNIHRGERVRCHGFPYTSVMRSELLEILQERCRDLGVTMNFETDIEDPAALADESNLLIGADGLGSETREAFADAFEPTLLEREDKFAWFGTEKQFDALTHIYEETEDGVWHAGAYPARSVSTFAITADEETWRAAGIQDASEEEYLAYLEDVFSDHLDGHELLTKEDRWRNFVTVKNETWHHENVALLGDAAHTAHYTIGAGTRMAIEDAISLADGIERHPDDLNAALEWYESDRRPHVEGLQDAAELSVTHFENLPRYIHMDPIQLAFLYLTRTGYNSYGDLRRRDPEFAENVDEWFATTHGGGIGDDGTADPPASQPFELRETRFENRTITPLSRFDSAEEGHPGAAYLEQLVDRTTGEAGAVVTDPVAVSADGRITAGTPGLYESGHVDAWRDAIARTDPDTAIGTTLVHAGRRGAMRPQTSGDTRPLPPTESWDLLAPSSIPYTDDRPTPRAMTEDDLQRVREKFVSAAESAADAGFDFAQVHAGHGYLLGSFLSPLTNNRDDEYGGSLENRLRYPLEVAEAVRNAWPEEKPLGVVLGVSDWADDGFDLEDAFVAADALSEAGCDIVTAVAGGTVPQDEPVLDPYTFRLYSHRIRNEVGVPTVSTTYFTSEDAVNTMVAGGRADLCYRYHPSRSGEE